MLGLHGIGYIVIFGMRSPSCINGEVGGGWWTGGTGALVAPTASYVNAGIPFRFASGMWEFNILGGFRSFNQGWSSSDPVYIGATDGVATMKWTHPRHVQRQLRQRFRVGDAEQHPA